MTYTICSPAGSLRRFKALLPLSTLLLAANTLAAQQAAQQPVESAPPDASQGPVYKLKATTRLVVLDVVVLDKAGHPVPNLDRSQFTVLEDKVPQKLRSFEAINVPATVDPKAPLVSGTADLKKIGSAPVNILVFDELNSKFEDTAFARSKMKDYILKQPDPLPVPTQLVAAGDAKFVVLHDYTQNRGELLTALDQHMPSYPWQMMRNQSGDGAAERMAQTLGILAQIADASSGTRGRKNVVWIGTGYPLVDETVLDEDDQDKIMAVIKRVTQRMLASRVALYIIDPAGVHGMEQDAGTDDEGTASLGAVGSGLGPFEGKLEFSTFARATGGEIFSGRNDLDHEIETGLHEASIYYTLGYTPTSSDDAAAPFRKITVVLNDKSLHAVTRQGYFPGPLPVEAPPSNDTKASQQLRWDIASASSTTLAYNGLDVKAFSSVHGYALNVTASDLTWNDQQDGSRVAEVTVMATAYNAKGKELLHRGEELKEKIGPNDNIENGARAGFTMPVAIPSGAVRIRFVVRDAGSGKIGSVEIAPKP